MDVVSQKTVREFLKHHNATSRTTILLTSHYMQDIEELCERVILIDHGCVMFDGALEGIVEQFSGSKIIDAKFSAPDHDADFSLYRFSLGKNTGLGEDRGSPRARVAEVCRFVLDRAPVADLTVAELPIEDVIRTVFGKKPS